MNSIRYGNSEWNDFFRRAWPVKNATKGGELFPRVVEIRWHEDVEKELKVCAAKIKQVCEVESSKDRLSPKWACGVGYNSHTIVLYNISNGERLRSIERIFGHRQNLPPPVAHYRYFGHKIETLSVDKFPGIFSNPRDQCRQETVHHPTEVRETEVPSDQTILEIYPGIHSSSTTIGS